MKIVFRSALLIAFLMASSCSKDTNETPIDQTDEIVEELEQTALEVNKVSDNLVIAGSTKEEGMPPSPTGNLTFDISNTSKTALLREGFDVTINHESNIVGAYLMVKTEEGSTADAYFDVNIEANNSTSKKRIRTKKGKAIDSKSKETETKLDIDFTAEIEPGIFCYDLYIYDSEGNVSDPKEVCMTVQSWGGKAEVVGKWELDKIIHQYTDGQINDEFTLPGVEDCTEAETYNCSNGEFEASGVCLIQEYYNLELKADGNFVLGHKDSESFLNEDASIEMCKAVYEEALYGYDATGKWAYDDKNERIILIEYSGVELYDGETEEYTYEPGQGEPYYGAEGDIKLQDGFIVFPFETSKVYLKR